MKSFKKLVLALVSISVLTLTSCQPDEDNNGNGTPTPTDEREKFVASWTTAEKSAQNGTSSYTVHIKKDANNSNRVLIENFYNFGFQHSAYATVSGNDLTIPEQTFSGNKIKGSGTLYDPKKITMNYTVDDGSGGASAIDNVSATLSKQ